MPSRIEIYKEKKINEEPSVLFGAYMMLIDTERER